MRARRPHRQGEVVMRAFLTRCTLRNGARVVMNIMASSSCHAIVIAQETLGEALQVCSARPF